MEIFMQEYTFEKRDFSAIDKEVEAFNKIPREGIIDNFNRRIDLDYISNSDMIENMNSDHDFLLDVIHNQNLKVLRSYPRLFVNDPNMKSGEVSDKLFNVNGLDADDQNKAYRDYLKNTELVVYDKSTDEEFHIKTTGHLLAVYEVINEARRAKMLKQSIGHNVDLTAEFIADNVNCHVLGEPFGRYRSPWYYPVIGLKGVDWCIPGGRRVDEEMENLLNWYNNESADLHPLERAAIFHIEFIRIHPFADGNGRTGRLLVNYELVKNGYPTITIKATQRREYLEAINEAVMTGNATKMIDLLASRMQSRLRLYDQILSEDGQEQ